MRDYELMPGYSGRNWGLYFIIYDVIAIIYLIGLIMVGIEYISLIISEMSEAEKILARIKFSLTLILIPMVYVLSSRWEYRKNGPKKKKEREYLNVLMKLKQQLLTIKDQEFSEEKNEIEQKTLEISKLLNQKSGLSLSRPRKIGWRRSLLEFWVSIREISLLISLVQILFLGFLSVAMLLMWGMNFEKFKSSIVLSSQITIVFVPVLYISFLNLFVIDIESGYRPLRHREFVLDG